MNRMHARWNCIAKGHSLCSNVPSFWFTGNEIQQAARSIDGTRRHRGGLGYSSEPRQCQARTTERGRPL
jgi:hypothetical protein